MINIIILIISLIAFFCGILAIFVWIYAYVSNKEKKEGIYYPKVNIIIPCKGLNEGFEENINAICKVDYPSYEIIFVVDSQKDSAYPILEKICKKNNHAQVIISKNIKGTSGKISALISGLQKAKDTEVYVFADSDIKPHKQLLKKLVYPLSEKNIGASTGFRWFFPSDFKSSLMTVWNMTSMIGLFHPLTNIVWGGSTAIKKSVFEKLKIKAKWKNAFSDDLVVTEEIKKTKYKIKFIPECTLESTTEADIKTFLKWGTQQFTWVRWHYPKTCFAAFFGLLLIEILMFLGPILIVFGYIIPGIILTSLIFLEMIFGLTGIIVMQKLMIYSKEKYGNIIVYMIFMPLVFLLFTYNFSISLFKKEIKWAGRIYKKEDALAQISKL